MQIKLKWGDLVIAGLILALAASITMALALHRSHGQIYAEVWQDGVLLERVPLTETTNRMIDLDGHNTIILEGLTARMAAADCQDQVCVRTGTLTRAGQAAVCLPHKVVLRLTGQKNEVDAIVS